MKLNDAANQYVIADAVRIERVGSSLMASGSAVTRTADRLLTNEGPE